MKIHSEIVIFESEGGGIYFTSYTYFVSIANVVEETRHTN